MKKRTLGLIIAGGVAIAIGAVVLVWFFAFHEKKAPAELTFTTFTTDEGFAVDYPNWQKLDIANPEAGMPADLVSAENLKIHIYATNGAAVVQISERVFDQKKSFGKVIEEMVKSQRETVKDLLIWRNQIGSTSALLEATSVWNGIKMHTVSKAFDVGGGKIYSVAFITADNNWKLFKDIADRVIYSAKVWR